MIALLWISGIVATIWLAFYFGKKLGGSYGASIRSGLIVSGFWLFWTFGFSSLIVGYALTGPLVIFQAAVVLVVFFLSYRYLKKMQKKDTEIQGYRATLKDLKDDLERLDNENLKSRVEGLEEEKIECLQTNKEHTEILLNTLVNVQHTLCIQSGWATSYVVNEQFRRRLKQCLARGVQVYIGYGYQRSNEKQQKKKYEKDAERRLKELQRWSASENVAGNLHIKYYPNHSKILICDTNYAVNGSFNWLSNGGRSRNQERSWVIYDEGFVKNELEIIIRNFLIPTKKNSG